MVLDSSALEAAPSFPRLPGASAFGLPLEVLHARPEPPALILATLRALRRRPQADKPPSAWVDVIEGEGAADIVAMGPAFGLLRGTDGRWRELPAKALLPRVEAERRLWLGCAGAVRADLQAWGETVAAALARIEPQWRAARAPIDAAEAEQHERALTELFMREGWPYGVVLWWIAYRYRQDAFEALRRELPELEVDVSIDMPGGRAVIEPKPKKVLLAECRGGGRVVMQGLRSGELEVIDRRFVEMDGFRISDDGASAYVGDGFTRVVQWTGLTFDRASVLAAFPAPVGFMAAVREWYAGLQDAQEDAAGGVAAGKRTPNKGGRPRKERIAAAQVIRDLWKPDEPAPKYRQVTTRLKVLKGDVRNVSRDTFDAAMSDVKAERASTNKPENLALPE